MVHLHYEKMMYLNLHVTIVFRKFASQIVTARKTRCSKGSPTPKGEGGNEHLGIRRFCALVLTVGNPENFKSRQKQSNVTPLGCIISVPPYFVDSQSCWHT